MIRNYFKTAWRNLKKNKSINYINFFGLSIGIAAIILVGVYIFNELHYDRFHKNLQSICRVDIKYYSKGVLQGEGSEFVAPFAPEVKATLPEVKSFCRISSLRQLVINTGADKFIADNICHADSSFFNMFSFKLLQGDPLKALQEPFGIVLTKSLANKLYDSENVLGKTLKIDGNNVYTITGIAESPPYYSSIQFNAIISFTTLNSLYPKTSGWDLLGWNGGNQFTTYFQLNSASQQRSLESKLPAFLWEKINKEYEKTGAKIIAAVHPLKDVHLKYNEDSKTVRTNLYVFAIVGVLILIISIVNYINLTTAQAFSRFKEIAMRKVLGATKNQIIKQAVGESILMVVLSALISLVIIYCMSFILKKYIPDIELMNYNNAGFIVALFILLLLIVGLGAGSYLAFYLSSLNVTSIFKSHDTISKTGFFKNALIVFQFAISIALIAITLIVAAQVRYLKNKPLGFDREKVLVVSLNSNEGVDDEKLLKERIQNLAGVRAVSGTSEVPYNDFTSNGFLPEDRTDYVMPHHLVADKDFFKVFHIKIDGSNTALQQFESRKDMCFINQTMANSLGWTNNAVGRKIKRDTLYTIAGVVEDFNYASLHNKIEPLIITKSAFGVPYSSLSIKYNIDQPQVLVKQIKSIWAHTVNDAPFDYWFLDNAFDNIYKREQKFQSFFLLFSLISIILSLAGIFGLVSINLSRRVKEIGIRKVLGAGIPGLVKLILSKFALIIIIGAVVAIPASWLYINKWLQGFEYRIHITSWFFIAAFLLVLVVTLLVIGYQAIRAAIMNPVKSLRNE